MNGDFNLDGKLVFPSGADNSNLIRAHATESAKGIGASGQIRFVTKGDEEGYWYLYNHPSSDWADYDEGTVPSGQRIATLGDLVGTEKTVMVRTQRINVTSDTNHIAVPASGEYFQLRARLRTATGSEMQLKINDIGSGYLRTRYGTSDQAQTLRLDSELINTPLPIGGTSIGDNGGAVAATIDVYDPAHTGLSPIIQTQLASTSGQGVVGAQQLSYMFNESILLDLPSVTVSGVNITGLNHNSVGDLILEGSYVDVYEAMDVNTLVGINSQALNDLTDVTAASPTNSEVLVYDGNGWSTSGVVVSRLHDVGDVVNNSEGRTFVGHPGDRIPLVWDKNAGRWDDSGSGLSIYHNDNAPAVYIKTNGGGANISAINDNQSQTNYFGRATHAAYNHQIYWAMSNRSASSAFSFFEAFSSSGGDTEINLRGDGAIFSDISASTPADYAEYFESVDPSGIEPGYAVQLSSTSGLIELASSGTEIIGFVSAAPAMAADAAWDRWHNKYLKDKFGAYQLDLSGHRQLNPAFDPEQEYVPRSDRPEWQPVGMLGKIWVRSSDTDVVAGDSVKLDVSSSGMMQKASPGDSPKWRVIEAHDYDPADGYQVVKILFS
jgi:hypothetical protein